MSSITASSPPVRTQRLRALAASTVGTTIEWYDFFLYGTAAALVFPKVFFPGSTAYSGVLLSFGTQFVGFAARPIGAMLFVIAELLVLAIVAILVLLMVVRPLVARLIEAIPKPSTSPAMLSDRTGAAGQLPGPGPAPNIASAAAAQQREELEQMIDINQVEGRVKASSLKKIGEIIDKHPEETVSIIRTWMFQET